MVNLIKINYEYPNGAFALLLFPFLHTLNNIKGTLLLHCLRHLSHLHSFPLEKQKVNIAFPTQLDSFNQTDKIFSNFLGEILRRN